MANVATRVTTTLYRFMSGFGLEAYPETNVPDDAVLPYLTYTVPVPEWESGTTLQIRLWYKDTSFVAINKKTDEIMNKVGGGLVLYTDEDRTGALYLSPGNPFAQYQPVGDPSMKIAYINLDFYAFLG